MDAANSWTDERVELLKKLWANGLSASQIATQMGGVTRNAVIGKVHRLGLSGRGKVKAAAPRARRATEPRLAKTAAPAPELVETFDTEDQVEEVAAFSGVAVVDEVALPQSERVTIMELRESMCRWPIGDPTTPDFRFCGSQSVPGVPYCNHHCQIAYQPVAERRRRAS